MKNADKGPCILGVLLDEIAVEVVVAGIAPEAITFRSVLIGPGMAVPVQRTTDIVHRYNHDHCVFRQQFGCVDPLMHQANTGVHAIGLTGMNGIVDKQ